MIAFIIPLRPKSESNNWASDCRLLNNTINSISRQEDKDFEIFIVYTDHPGLKIDNSKIHFVHFPYPFIQISNDKGYEKDLYLFNNDVRMFEKRLDKGRRICYGSMVAKKRHHKYIMSVDADDLVSNKLVSYLLKRIKESNVPGFYIDKGYLYTSGKKAMIKIPGKMNLFNGSTHILREDFVTVPDFSSKEWLDYSLFTAHGWIVERLKEKYGCILEVVPFPAIIYVAHSGNLSRVNRLNLKDKVKRLVKSIIRRQVITKDIKAEFSM